jgi:DNA-binding LacI/PurR family transcriptional regulator
MSDEELLFPDISAIIQPTEDIGRNAVRLLLKKSNIKKSHHFN